MWEPVLAVGFAAASLVAVIRHLAARRSARALRGLRAENDSLLREISRTAKLGEFKVRFQDSEERFRSLMEHATFQIVLKDSEGRYLQVNRVWENDCGIPAASAIGKTLQDFYGAPLADEFARRDQAVLRGGSALEIEEVVPHSDGTDHHYITTRFPIVDNQGNIKGLGFVAKDITERKQTEMALRESEERFRAFMEHAPFEFILKDSEDRYVEVNPTWEAFFGLSNEDAFGKTPEQLFGGEFADRLSRRDRAVLKSGRPLETEDRVPHPDGTSHLFHTNTFPIPDRDGSTASLGMISVDITERRRAEQALRESEEQLRTIADNLPVMIVRWDNERRYTFANRLAEDWYGRPAPRIVGMSIGELFGSALPDEIETAIEVALAGQAIRLEASLTYPDGRIREVDIAYVPDFSCEGAVVGCFGLVQDISERKAAERALREREEQLRTVAENMPALMTRFDRDGRYSFVNRIARELYARPAEDVVGRSIREIMGEENWKKLEPRFATVMAGQEVWFEERLHYPDGAERHVEIAYLPDFDEHGEVRGAFALSHDVTDRKKLEAELLRSERLAVLGQLTGTVAHELRNPLGAVVMSLEVIRRECESAGLDLERALTRADRGLKRCETIITELLDFARAKGLRRQATTLDSWLGSVLDEHNIPEAVQTVRELRDNDIEVQVDREELRRAVINVVDNACQAMTQDPIGDVQTGTHALTVTVRASDSRIELGFVDTGPGIPDDLLPQVMEPLFSTKPFGTGLGLPTVKRIMEQHDGGVEVDSAPGSGTRVVLWLPAENSGGGDVGR